MEKSVLIWSTNMNVAARKGSRERVARSILTSVKATPAFMTESVMMAWPTTPVCVKLVIQVIEIFFSFQKDYFLSA